MKRMASAGRKAGGFFALVLAAVIGQGPAMAGDGTVTLSSPPPIASGQAAFPRIESVGDSNATPAAIARINTALEKADGRLRSAAAGCTAQAGGRGSAGWQRSVEVATAGPDYLALVVSDDLFCGGAHPDTATFALAFDLTTGSPLNWSRLLPIRLAGAASLDSAPDGTRLGILTSPALTKAYLAGYSAAAKATLDTETRDACRENAFSPPVSFVLWPAADPAGLVLVPESLPHVVAACAVPVRLSVSDLTSLGVSPAFAATLARARR